MHEKLSLGFSIAALAVSLFTLLIVLRNQSQVDAKSEEKANIYEMIKATDDLAQLNYREIEELKARLAVKK